MKQIISAIMVIFFLTSCMSPNIQEKQLLFASKPYDRIIFVYKKRKLEFPLKEKQTIIKFNDCKPHLLNEYKNNKMTLKSLKMCESNMRVLKAKNNKYYISGKLNIYDSYSFYSIFGNKAQVFNKKTIGVITDFERFVYGLKTKGIELKVGLNKSDNFDGIEIYIIKKGLEPRT